ncbi:MAG: isoprenylcysteine carboxylmethyltransferase family protein [Anaerolineales bacterium]|jgi:protein-S-isoprenylcysteine O-methyltransferase Ste14
MNENLFRFILPMLILAFVAHRGYYIKKQSKPNEETLEQREEGSASKLASFLGLMGFLSTLAFVIYPDWLSRTNLSLPTWLRWVGVPIAFTGFVLLQWAQNTLGKSWSDTPRMMKTQELITSGPYRIIRHPIYTAFILILGSTLLISANWLIGLSWIGMTVLETISRIRFEEGLMLEYFGEQYREYMNKTGKLFPKVI